MSMSAPMNPAVPVTTVRLDQMVALLAEAGFKLAERRVDPSALYCRVLGFRELTVRLMVRESGIPSEEGAVV